MTIKDSVLETFPGEWMPKIFEQKHIDLGPKAQAKASILRNIDQKQKNDLDLKSHGLSQTLKNKSFLNNKHIKHAQDTKRTKLTQKKTSKRKCPLPRKHLRPKDKQIQRGVEHVRNHFQLFPPTLMTRSLETFGQFKKHMSGSF